MSRCIGHCCTAFPLPYSMEQLRAMADGRGEPNEMDKEDIKTIADMVYPLDWVPTAAEVAHDVDWQRYTYGCKNLKENGDCAIYERRPRMCRDYPYGKPCPIPGCTHNGIGKPETKPKDKASDV